LLLWDREERSSVNMQMPAIEINRLTSPEPGYQLERLIKDCGPMAVIGILTEAGKFGVGRRSKTDPEHQTAR
jgi:hypothetical protein